MAAHVASDLLKTLKNTFGIKLATLSAAGLTAARTHTLQDRTGTFGHLDQVIHRPTGRLTLESGVAVTKTDQTNKTSVFYTPYVGDLVPIYDGTVWKPTIFTELTLALATSGTGFQKEASNYDLFVVNDAGTIRLGTGPAWTRAATVTMTIASPCIVTWTANGIAETFSLVFTTTGALPTGVTAGTTYYKKTTPSDNTFQIAATPGGAAINTSGSQSGVHTATESNTVRGTGAGTTELERKNGLWTNKNSMTLRWGSGSGETITVAANQGTYVGTLRVGASAGTTSDNLAFRLLWNMYNRALRSMLVLELTNEWTYSTLAWRQMNASVANQLVMVRGMDEDGVTAVSSVVSNNDTAGINTYSGIGHNVTSGFSGFPGNMVTNSTNIGRSKPTGFFSGTVGLGHNWLAALEQAGGATTTWYGDAGVPLDFASGIMGQVMS